MRSLYFLIRLAIVTLLLSLGGLVARAQQSVGIGTTVPNAKAALDIVSTDKGLLVPRLTAAQRTAIASPPPGLLVYQTDGLQPGFWYYEATAGWTFLNPTGDNLGNHTATQNLRLNGNWLSYGAKNYGLHVAADNRVGVDLANGTSWRTQLADSGNFTLLLRDRRPETTNQVGPHLTFAIGEPGHGNHVAMIDYVQSDTAYPFRNQALEVRSYGRDANSRINFYTGLPGYNIIGGPQVSIRANGSMGIGLGDSLDPYRPLHVRGGIHVSGPIGEFSFTDRLNRNSRFVWYSYGDVARLYGGLVNAGGVDLLSVHRTTGRVGIGTTAAGYKLHLIDTTRASVTTAMFEGNGDVWSGVYARALKQTGRPFYGYLRPLGYGAYHYVDNNGDWVLRVGYSQLFALSVQDTTGNVGVGTGLVRNKLHVYSGKQYDGLRIHVAQGFGAGTLSFWSDPQGSPNEWRPGFIRSTDNGNFTGGLAFFTNGSTFAHKTDSVEVMRLTNSKVGIGTSNPVSKLHVVTDNSLGGGEDDYLFDTYGNNGDLGLFLRKSRGTVAAPQNVQNGDRVGLLNFAPRVNGSMGYFSGSGIESYYLGDGTTFLSDLRFTTSGGQLRMRVTETGNVAIGTFTANSRLSITPTATEPKITLWDGNDPANHYGFGISGFQLNYHVRATSDNHVFYAGGKNGDGTELARLTGTGYFGVGTAPSYRLHISDDNAGNQTVAQFDGTNASFAGMYVNAEVSTSAPFYGYKRQGSIVGYHYVDNTNVWRMYLGGVRMSIDGNSGNVGIGVNPVANTKLAVGNGNVAGVALAVTSGLVTLSSTSLAVVASGFGRTLTATAVIYNLTDNGGANGAEFFNAGVEGQLLIVTNLDPQPVNVNSTSLASGATRQYVYTAGAWRALN